MEKMEEMVKENKGSLFWEMYEDAESAEGQQLSEKITDQPEHQESETEEEHFQSETPGMPFYIFIKTSGTFIIFGANKQKPHSGRY